MSSEKKTYQGGCHCGAVTFEADMDLEGLGDCNCSRCSRLGWVMKFLPASDFRLLSGEDMLTEYRFNTKTIEHKFCKVCGIESFGRGEDGDGNKVVTVNVNCLEGVEIDHSKVQHFDGKSF